MHRPAQLWDQYKGKAEAELLRGCGCWPLQFGPCPLEPPWELFDSRSVNPWDCVVNNWEKPWGGNWLQRAFDLSPPLVPHGAHLKLPGDLVAEGEEVNGLVAITVEQFSEDEETIPKADLFLRSLSALKRPISFEILGVGPTPRYDLDKLKEILAANARGENRHMSEARIGQYDGFIVVQFVARRDDAKLVNDQLVAQYPNSAVVPRPEDNDSHDNFWKIWDIKDGSSHGGVLGLESMYCKPLRIFSRLDTDPLTVAIGAMEDLGESQWAALQVLLIPAKSEWADTAQQALAHPYDASEFWIPKEEMRLVREKFSSPLFAVSMRLFASRAETFRHLVGWAEQFANPPHQRLTVDERYWEAGKLGDAERETLGEDAVKRQTHRPGILLNTAELASMVHLPSASVISERLRRVKTRTRPPAQKPPENTRGVIIGENVHRGKITIARIPPDLRPRHCYIAGASGTGKSTLLLNMMVQDIQAGHGVGLLDPHGDLVSAVLRRIPQNRVNDVILFDPADEEFPFALNIIEAKDESENERIVAETVMSLERYFPASWGPRLERILTYAIHTVLRAIPGATIADVESLLTNEEFRDAVIPCVNNKRLHDFWEHEFKHFPKNASDPVLNKLQVFLSHRVVRNIVCQRHTAVDFDKLLNQGKILLVNLSSGLLTSKIACTFGSFLVTKIVNAAFRRARIPEEQRRPFYLYVDEFQDFTNLSVGFERILAEARKYRLVLAGLANQYVDQLPSSIRHAIFGNAGVMAVFRLGVTDAHLVAKEMGVFTAEEIMNLELGQAIVRTGGSSTAHNIQTYPPCPPPEIDPTTLIRQQTRQLYGKPRADVERELEQPDVFTASTSTATSESVPTPPPLPGASSKKRRRRGNGNSASDAQQQFPTDPNEDDLVN
jgi:hypothetical protein